MERKLQLFSMSKHLSSFYITELKHENKECVNHASCNIQVLWIQFLKRHKKSFIKVLTE